jgi:hypothetical protein
MARVSPTDDLVRWLINRQSFDGTWLFNDDDMNKLTQGKSLTIVQSNIRPDSSAYNMAVAIAVLQSKYADQKNLWFAIVDKARQHLYRSGLSKDQVNVLINEIQRQL